MDNKKVTAIILSYLRPQNLNEICKTMLSTREISEVIVSNNNIDVDITSYITITSPNLKIINQSENKGAFIRYIIALNSESNFFIAIDDDLFLKSCQISYLIKKIFDDVSVPHGFWGQNFSIDKTGIKFEYGIINKEQHVDILNRLYLFTKQHVNEIFRLKKETSITEVEIGPCDDIFVSFSGVSKPRSHYIGGYVDCPTSNEIGIAQWLDSDFDKKRSLVLGKILQVKNFNL